MRCGVLSPDSWADDATPSCQTSNQLVQRYSGCVCADRSTYLVGVTVRGVCRSGTDGDGWTSDGGVNQKKENLGNVSKNKQRTPDNDNKTMRENRVTRCHSIFSTSRWGLCQLVFGLTHKNSDVRRGHVNGEPRIPGSLASVLHSSRTLSVWALCRFSRLQCDLSPRHGFRHPVRVYKIKRHLCLLVFAPFWIYISRRWLNMAQSKRKLT